MMKLMPRSMSSTDGIVKTDCWLEATVFAEFTGVFLISQCSVAQA